jgi:hypothetical protein
VREATDEMEVTDQRQRRGRRREFAPALPVLNDVEEAEKKSSAGDGEHESRHLLLTLPVTEAEADKIGMTSLNQLYLFIN